MSLLRNCKSRQLSSRQLTYRSLTGDKLTWQPTKQWHVQIGWRITNWTLLGTWQADWSYWLVVCRQGFTTF
jgi:hypothetical protein